MTDQDNKNKKEKTTVAAAGRILKRDIKSEMEESYIDYAMSVIVSRALPDLRDGLKPVQRRILYAMKQMGLTSDAKFRKSATVTGTVMGQYHPHGDAPIYEALVRMAQPWSMRYPLIEGQGNFGSLDDPPGAQRYTEARLAKISDFILQDIEKETVDFVLNYDATREEPRVLPSVIPNLLLNGALGIAVGMATNIPPHNLNELADALIYLIDHPGAADAELLSFVQGPDFPSGGLIFNKKDIASAYATGRGGVLNRGEAEIEETKSGQFQIVVSSLPFQVSKASLIQKMAELVKEKKADGVRDIRDESNREGLRIVIELKSGAPAQKILNYFYTHTELERMYHFNMLAMVDGLQPEVLSFKKFLEHFVKFRQEIVTKRSRFELRKAEERAHILEGLKKALDHIDEIIRLIRAAADRESAKNALIRKFDFSELQAEAILETKLSALARLEREKIEEELKQKQKLIKELKALLKDPKKILEVVKKEFLDAKSRFGDSRKTKIIALSPSEFKPEDLVPEKETIVILTKGMYIKRVDPQEYRAQKRGGKGIMATEIKEEDVIDKALAFNTHDDILFFTNLGKVYRIKVYDISEEKRMSKGKSIVNLLSLMAGEKITAGLRVSKTEKDFDYLAMVTKGGLIKKTAKEKFNDVRKSGLIAIRLKQGDTLADVVSLKKEDEIFLATKNGQMIRFKEKDLRPMSRSAAGVKALRLKKNDEVISAGRLTQDDKNALLLVANENSYAKLVKAKYFKTQRRGGSGIKIAKTSQKVGFLISVKILTPDLEEVIATTKMGKILRTPLKNIPELSRTARGNRIIRIDPGDILVSLTCL